MSIKDNKGRSIEFKRQKDGTVEVRQSSIRSPRVSLEDLSQAVEELKA